LASGLTVLITLGLAWAGLFLWNRLFPATHCLVALAISAVVVEVIALGMLEHALLRRRAFIGMYLKEQGWLFRLLRGGALLLIWQVVKAMGLATVLLVESVLWTGWIWTVLGIDVLFLAVAYPWVCRRLAAQVRPEYVEMLARRFLVFANTVFFSWVVAVVSYYTPHKDYRAMTLLEAAQHEALQVQSKCQAFAVIARISAAKNAASWWLAERWLGEVGPHPFAWLGWLVFLVLSAAFMWAYSRFLLGLLVKPSRLFRLADPDGVSAGERSS
jgi:hypothetical protein